VLNTKHLLAGGQYEVETQAGIETQRLYLDGSPYSASIVIEKTGSAAAQPYYIHRDYLGSVTQISDKFGNLAAEYSYDAWGRMRDITSWQVYAPGTEPELLFGRGYTGHEHLIKLGLINMNARLYDPVLGRIISPDPLVGSDLTNDFNRYIYCRNNPMMYTDQSGKFIGWAILAGYALYTGICYLSAAKEHNWEMNPTKWKETTYTVGYSSNTGGFAGISFDNGIHSSNIGYDFSKNNFNLSASQHGNTIGANPFKKPSNPEQLLIHRENEIRESQYLFNSFSDYFRYTVSNYLSNVLAWDTPIMRGLTGDAIAYAGNLSLAFLGGGSNSSGVLIPLRGPNAFRPFFVNTASFRMGAQTGADISASRMWYNGPVKDAFVSKMEGKGYSFDVNFGLAAGFGPGFGGFTSVDEKVNKITWYGYNVSFGWGYGGSIGIDYTKLW
jgi:RHS repeat-associated protein